ncbi:MAG: ATP phosphoribosyltransferase [Rhizomicrobium sp.]
MSGPLVMALPSKGRLHDQAIDFLNDCGFGVRKSGDGREYVAKLSGIEGVSIIYFRPDEIPARIDLGDAHVGLTGEDLYREYGEGQHASHLLMPNLGFGAARLVVGVPQSWIDVSTLNDLDEAAMLFHQKHGRSLRVATKFARLTRAFFAENGIVEYTLVESAGATEGTPAAGVADLIVDLTSTGATMTQNHLKEIEGGTVIRSHCCMIAALKARLWSQGTLAALEHVVEQIEARTRAKATQILRFSIPHETAAQTLRTLNAKHGCTVTSVRTENELSGRRDFVVALCGPAKVHGAVHFLRNAGSAETIVDRSEFIYQGGSAAIAGFKDVLKRAAEG